MQEDKVNVQFFLDAETRAQLKELSRVRRLSTGEMLHDLIVEEYKGTDIPDNFRHILSP